MGRIVIELTLPWPPSVNGYWRSPSRGPLAGRTLLSEEGRRYRVDAIASILESGVPRGTLKGKRIAVTIGAHPPDRRRRDLDNLLKGLLDALHHADVIGDDSDIDSLHIERGEVRPGGEVFVTVSER